MNYDIAIIGGGITGSSAAYFLSLAANAGRVCVIEPDPAYARASTPHGAGGVRRLFSRPENVAMSQFSLDFYADFANNVDCGTDGVDISFRRQGYLFVVGKNGINDLEKNADLQLSMGVPAEILDVASLRDRFPSLGLEDIALGCHSPQDAWIDPYSVLQGFRRGAENNGVDCIQASVDDLDMMGGLVKTARLDNGEQISADMFINCAGPWCGEIAQMAGLEVPVKPMCRVQHYWLCEDDVEPMPLVKDESGMFFRPEGNGFAGGCPSFDIDPGFIFDVDRGFFANYFEETVWPLIATRLPKFERIKLQRTWGGHYAQNTFDGNMIIGKISDRVPNMLTACGFSGHGVMHAPAVGRALSELALHNRYETLDLSAMGMDRVRENQPYGEAGIR
jgi:FAD-dependent oxidoreductase domain-containing protein 1